MMNKINQNREKLHRAWIRKQNERYPEQREGDKIYCGICKCEGNQECGHLPLSKEGCVMIEEDFMCPCCFEEPNSMGDQEYDEMTGQSTMNFENLTEGGNMV